MADKLIKTIIRQRIDTYENWSNTTAGEGKGANFVLDKGEIGICTIDTVTTDAKGNILHVPTCLMKVGDGSSKFSELPWLSAPAADVHDWAKAATAPDEFDTKYTWTIGEDGTVTVNETLYTNGVAGTPTQVATFNYMTEAEVKAITDPINNKIGDLTGLDEAVTADTIVEAINKTLAAVEAGGAGSVVTVEKAETPTEGSEVTYVVKQGNKAVDVKIEIPKYDDTEYVTPGALTEAIKDFATDGELAEVSGVATGAATAAGELKTRLDNNTDGFAKAADVATKAELEGVKATAEAAVTDAKLATALEPYAKTQDVADTYETKANVKKVADDLSQYKTDNDAAVALKADKSVVDAMYTNGQIDTAVQGAKDYAKGLVDAIPAQTDYTVTITENTDDNAVAKTYVFTQNGAEIGAIKLAKELVVTSGSVKEVTVADAPYAGAKVGDKYIELVIANQDTPIYVPAKDLVDIYTAKDGAAEVQVAISNTNEISATLVNGGITEAKLHADVTAKLNKTWEEVGVAQGLVNALAEGQVKTNKEAIENITKEGGAIDAAIAEEVTRANGAYDEKGAAAAAQSAAEAKAAELDTATNKRIDELTTDDIAAGTETWIFDCGNSGVV